MVAILKAVGLQLLAVIGQAILDAGGSESDLRDLRLSNAAEIDRVLSQESDIAAKVKALLNAGPTV